MRIVIREYQTGNDFCSAPHKDSIEQWNCITWEFGKTKSDAREAVRKTLAKRIADAQKSLKVNTEYMEELEKMGYWDQEPKQNCNQEPKLKVGDIFAKGGYYWKVLNIKDAKFGDSVYYTYVRCTKDGDELTTGGETSTLPDSITKI